MLPFCLCCCDDGRPYRDMRFRSFSSALDAGGRVIVNVIEFLMDSDEIFSIFYIIFFYNNKYKSNIIQTNETNQPFFVVVEMKQTFYWTKKKLSAGTILFSKSNKSNEKRHFLQKKKTVFVTLFCAHSYFYLYCTAKPKNIISSNISQSYVLCMFLFNTLVLCQKRKTAIPSHIG